MASSLADAWYNPLVRRPDDGIERRKGVRRRGTNDRRDDEEAARSLHEWLCRFCVRPPAVNWVSHELEEVLREYDLSIDIFGRC
jgi:hypothetical protein